MHLQLNNWLGQDKPKKDDFNSDNQILDEAYRKLSKSVEKLESSQKDGIFADSGLLEAHTGDSSIHVTADDKAGWDSAGMILDSHKDDSSIHVTAGEKEAWSSSSGFIMGTYQGSGSSSQKITLGYQPRFGIVFAAGDGIVHPAWTTQLIHTLCGFISKMGCSLGLVLNSDGFTAEQSMMGGFDGLSIKFNNSGTTYVYVLWK